MSEDDEKNHLSLLGWRILNLRTEGLVKLRLKTPENWAGRSNLSITPLRPGGIRT